MTCLITGCAAFNGHQYVGGDLHQVGDCYVFNCILERGEHGVRYHSGEAAWASREDWAHYPKIVDFSAAIYWERRGTLVAPARECTLNDAAREYLHV